MADVVAPKRKASELEDPSATVDGENGLNKRARKATEEADETVEGTSNKDSEDGLEDDLANIENAPVQIKRARVDYADPQVTVEDNQNGNDEEGEDDDDEEEDQDDDEEEEEEEAADEQQAQPATGSTAAAYPYTAENGTKGEQASEEGDDNDNDNYEEDDEDDE